MTDQPWAKLHLTTDATFSVAESALGDDCQAAFPEGGVCAHLYSNDQFRPHQAGAPYDFWENSQVYAEVAPLEDSNLNEHAFVEGVIRLVTLLRQREWVVTAVDNQSVKDLEERVMAATGWNWTEGNPTPPGWEA